MSRAWRELTDELSRWRDTGRPAEFWWRDDDAAQPDAALDRLLALAQRTAAPLALAVIPMQAEKDAFKGISPSVSIIQHGTDHRNRAAAGEKKTEFPAAESPHSAVARLAAARERLAGWAGGRFVPVLAPPWNRLPETLVSHLPAAGFRGLSRFGARPMAQPGTFLPQVNTHVDLIDWHAGRGFVGEEAALAAAVRHLAAKRAGSADTDEPTGWLSHHAVHDEAAWVFLERLFETLRTAPGMRWRSVQELFHVS